MIASIRHHDTDYDELLMTGVDRADARERVRDEVDRMLDRWRLGRPDAALEQESDLGE